MLPWSAYTNERRDESSFTSLRITSRWNSFHGRGNFAEFKWTGSIKWRMQKKLSAASRNLCLNRPSAVALFLSSRTNIWPRNWRITFERWVYVQGVALPCAGSCVPPNDAECPRNRHVLRPFQWPSHRTTKCLLPLCTARERRLLGQPTGESQWSYDDAADPVSAGIFKCSYQLGIDSTWGMNNAQALTCAL